jgi:Flp pilus assembly protein TadG
VLVTAIVEFGLTYNHYLALTDAVRDGARVAALSRTAADPVGSVTNEVVTSASDLHLDPSHVSVASSWQPGADVTVGAWVDYSINVFGIPVWSGRLTSSTTGRVE